MAPANTKQELIALLNRSRKRLEETIAKVPPEKWDQPGVNGAWAAKDVLAHVADWEEHHIAWLGAVIRGEKPKVPGPGYSWGAENIHRFNQAIYEAHCAQPFEQVLAYFRSMHAAFMAQLESLPAENVEQKGFAPFTGARRALTMWYAHFAFHDGWANKLIYTTCVRKPRKSKD
jgi:hypothetical protein